MAFGEKETYERFIRPHEVSNDYPSKFNFVLLSTLDEIREALKGLNNDIAIDTETTGLDLDVDFMVGYSFCYDGVNAYYVPVNHATYYEEILTELTKEEYDTKVAELNEAMDNSDVNAGLELNNYIYDDKEDKYYHKTEVEHQESLGEEAVDILYKAIKGKVVYMFNARYDIRVFEKYGFIENNIPIEERDLRHFYKYDMSPAYCNVVDVQALIFDTDTNVAYPSLKKSEEYFLGWRGASFADTVGGDTEDMSFYKLRPEEGYQYAATDALGTYLLAYNGYVKALIAESIKNNKYAKAGKYCSAQLDCKFLYPLKMMEDEYTVIDTARLQRYSDYYGEEITKLENRLYAIVGQEFRPDPNDKKKCTNPFGSPKQKSEMLKKLGITTLEYDSSPALKLRGELKADKEHINITIDLLKLEPNDPRREFMEGLLKYANLTKQKGTYVDAFIKMATNSRYPGRLRFGYKTMVVPSGRLAAGGDKKTFYTANTNIQNVPKPKGTMVYYVRYDDLIRVRPEFTGVYDNAYEECLVNGEYTYRVLNWVFKESVWNLGIPEKKIEGFEQKLNMRSTFCADPDKYWVSCDFSAQELRLAALLSGEPGWTKTFAKDGDLHEYMAKQIWDPSEYDKGKRKKAKKVNFGILYGMTAKNFSNDFAITMDEAQEIVDKYKAGAKKLFEWVDREERQAASGSVYTMFGRPRRLGWYFRPERSFSMQQFGKRSTANTIIQGSGGDILKMSFLNIYDLFFKNPETRNINRKYIKFINTVHDEINYNVSKKYIDSLVPKILSCMRMWFPDWQFPMKVGLAISSRWGTNIDFEYDGRRFIEITPDMDLTNVKRYKQMPSDWQKANMMFGPYSFKEDPGGMYIENPNYLHILEPAGEELTEKDYEVKEETKEEEIYEVIEEFDPNAPKIFDDLF